MSGPGIPAVHSGEDVNYFTSMADVEAKRPAFEVLVRQWVDLMDREG
jgi:hypothetical protein